MGDTKTWIYGNMHWEQIKTAQQKLNHTLNK